MMIPTVRIKSEAEGTNGYILINEEDYDPDVHELFEDSTATEKDKLIAEAAKLKIAAPSVLERWSMDRLRQAIAKANP